VRGDEFLAALFFLIGVPLILGWLVRTWLNHKKFMKVLQLKAESNSKLLDRFGSDPAVLEFLKSDASERLFEVQTTEAAQRVPPPYTRMLTALQVSCMLVSVGAGLLYIRHYMANRDSEIFLFLGTLGVSLGIGALLAAAAAFIVAKMWRNLNNEI
jgi:hypothetical protein